MVLILMQTLLSVECQGFWVVFNDTEQKLIHLFILTESLVLCIFESLDMYI